MIGEEIFKVVEDMPRFPGCEDNADKEARRSCSDQKLLSFLHDHIRYPKTDLENGIEGAVVVRFIVEKDGSLTGTKIVKHVGAGCGAETLRLIQSMNDKGIHWIPGKQKGIPVRVEFFLPVQFKIAQLPTA